MSDQSTHQDTRNIRATMMPRRPAGMGKIEKARDARHALIRLLPYLSSFKPILP